VAIFSGLSGLVRKKTASISGYLKAKFGSTAADLIFYFTIRITCGLNFGLKFPRYKPIYSYPDKIALIEKMIKKLKG